MNHLSLTGVVSCALLMPFTPEANATDEDVAIEAPKRSFWDGLRVGMFADAHYMRDWNRPTNPGDTAGVPHRAFTPHNGFQLSFLGFDASYDAESFGATASLRFGSSAPRLIGSGPPVLENVKQAYLTWRPTKNVAIDFGQFDTIYGAEVSESYLNFNYTHGALYFLMQPFYHTGLRGSYAITDNVVLKGLLVNGVNNPLDDDFSPHLGLQAGLVFPDIFEAYIGYLGAADSDGELFAHFSDLVVRTSVGGLQLLLNGDLGVSDPEGEGDLGLYYGVSLSTRYAIVDWFALAARGEFLVDQDGVMYGHAGGTRVGTGTFTIEVAPLPDRPLIFRLDNRYEAANEAIFPSAEGRFTDRWFSTVFGVVVTIGT